MSKRHEKRDRVRKAAGLPPWGSVVLERAKKTRLAREASVREATSRPPGARTAPSAPDPAPTPHSLGGRRCRWIDDGDFIARIKSGEEPWTCAAEAISLKPYCAEHDRLAHMPQKKRVMEKRVDPVADRIAARREIEADDDANVVLD